MKGTLLLQQMALFCSIFLNKIFILIWSCSVILG